MNVNEVKELLKQFDQSKLTEFDFRKGDFELYMNKNTVSQKNSERRQETSQTTTLPESNDTQASEKYVTAVQETSPAVETELAAENSEEIVSPLVGVVYLKPAPDKPVFKKIGDSIKQGEVICIVEAMKLMNEITATADGILTEILVDNEDVVEYNQPLFRVSKGV